MTREEAIETIKDICLTTEQLTRIEKALECLLSQPSLPSNLDEAAREIVVRMHPCMEDCLILGDRLTRGELIALVKAGAEWMAWQGVILNPSIDKFSCGAYNACVEQGTTSEDDVIVQFLKNTPRRKPKRD